VHERERSKSYFAVRLSSLSSRPRWGGKILQLYEPNDVFQISRIRGVEVCELVAVDVEDKHGLSLIDQGYDDLRFRQTAAGYMTWKIVDVGHDQCRLVRRSFAAHTFSKRNLDAS